MISQQITPEVEFNMAVVGNADRWVPACGGTEKEFTCKGFRLLYVYNPRWQKHAYLNLDTDMVLSDEEAQEILL